MPNISLPEFKGEFTKALADVYSDHPRVTGFFTSMFKKVEKTTKNISIEVQRGTEKVAVDVVRGTEGNRNETSRSTEKTFLPPYYREFFDATTLSFYDRTFGSSGIIGISGASFDQFVDETNNQMILQENKIRRAYEIQGSQVLLDGIVQLKNGVNIDFKRKAASLVDLGAANYWSVATVDPRKSLEDGAKFLRSVGKSQGNSLDVTMGEEVFSEFMKNPKVLESFDTRRIDVGFVSQPRQDSTGAIFHGTISAGAYKFNIWTYPEVYDNALNVSTPYMDPKKFVITPKDTNFIHAFAAVPMLHGKGTDNERFIDTAGAFHISNFVDPRLEAHIFDTKSAGLMIPTAVDQIYTGKALA